MSVDKNNFRFWVPVTEIKKAKDKNGKQIMRLGGIASTTRVDTDGEQLVPSGFDLKYYKDRPIINWNHEKSPDSIIGEGTKAELRKQGLYIEGVLFPENKKAQQAYQLAQTLRKNNSSLRLGWSVEGKVLERDAADPMKVTRAFISAVALTPSPKNPDSIVDIIKGNFNGWSDDEKPPVEETASIDDLMKSLNSDQDNIIDITRPDGRRVTVDDKYNVKIQKSSDVPDSEDDDEDEEKALTTATTAAVIPEHVDGTPKNLQNGGPQSKVKKSNNGTDDDTALLTDDEALVRIMKSNSVITFSQANKILQTLKTLTMAKTGTAQISDDLLEKSLAKLGFTKTTKKISKAEHEEAGEEEEDDDFEEEDEQEDGKTPGKNKKKGMKKANTISKRYKDEDEDDDDEDPEEEDRDEEDNEKEPADGSAKTHKKGMKKSNTSRALRSGASRSNRRNDDEDLEDFKEEMRSNFAELSDMVKSLGVIGKHSYDLSKGHADKLEELEERLAEFGDAPATGRKSVASRPVNRQFEKGMRGEDTIEKANNSGVTEVDVDLSKGQVLHMMDSITFSKGYNPEMADAMSLFEASGIIKPNIQKSIESEFKVKLVAKNRR